MSVQIPSKITFIVAIFLCFLLPTSHIQAQTGLTPEQRASLQAELAQVEAEQKRAAQDLSAAQSRSSSLAKDIAVLGAKIKKAQLDIKAKNLLIKTLGDDISSKQSHINSLEDRIEQGKETLAQILRKTSEIDDYTLPEVILSQSNLSGFFHDVDDFQAVQEGLRSTFEQIRSDKVSTAQAKDVLDKRRDAEIDAKYEISQQEKNITVAQAEQRKLLSISMGNEKAYADLVAQKQARASQIRATLFPLAGAVEIPFGEAYKFALEAETRTGIRPAFLLAVFAQESSLDKDATFGKHVGSCYLSDKNTGAGVRISTKAAVKNVMKPDRDVKPFLYLTERLGLDPYATLVSCPLASGGYGGAMGAAQFIPSTWVNDVMDRVAKLLGVTTPNPWNPEHAFMASAMYLTDLGAAKRTYTAERTAALRYYAGGNWNKSYNAFYGNEVMKKASTIQSTMIDQL